MGKKALYRRIDALQHQLEKSEIARKMDAAEREQLHDLLLEAGFLRISGQRTYQDRLRAAQAGVLVLADVAIRADSQLTMTQDEPPMSMFAADRVPGVGGPVRATMNLNFIGEPNLLDALAEHIR